MTNRKNTQELMDNLASAASAFSKIAYLLSEEAGSDDEKASESKPSVQAERLKRSFSCEPTVTRSWDIPHELSRRLRRCVYREEVTATAVVVEALTRWLDEYERTYGV